MSYDLQIWSAGPVALPPSPDGWSREGGDGARLTPAP